MYTIEEDRTSPEVTVSSIHARRGSPHTIHSLFVYIPISLTQFSFTLVVGVVRRRRMVGVVAKQARGEDKKTLFLFLLVFRCLLTIDESCEARNPVVQWKI